MKIDNPDHREHFRYQSAINRIAFTIFFVIAFSTAVFIFEVSIIKFIIVVCIWTFVYYFILIVLPEIIEIIEHLVREIVYFYKGH